MTIQYFILPKHIYSSLSLRSLSGEGDRGVVGPEARGELRLQLHRVPVQPPGPAALQRPALHDRGRLPVPVRLAHRAPGHAQREGKGFFHASLSHPLTLRTRCAQVGDTAPPNSRVTSRRVVMHGNKEEMFFLRVHYSNSTIYVMYTSSLHFICNAIICTYDALHCIISAVVLTDVQRWHYLSLDSDRTPEVGVFYTRDEMVTSLNL